MGKYLRLSWYVFVGVALMVAVGVANVFLWRHLVSIGRAPPAIIFGVISIALVFAIYSRVNAICLNEVQRLRKSKELSAST
jgi:hypothetical protein